jgi:indole-3-glycerol phosphate synthase
MTILDRIVETKHREIAAAKAIRPLADLIVQIKDMASPRDFFEACTRSGAVQIIAEVKKASPSAGVIRADFDPVEIAKIYEANGAACLSVLTDQDYFQGSLSYLTAISLAVQIPVLRKEFIIDRYQLYEARAAGADAILLIAEILPGSLLNDLLAVAESLGLTVLLELHDADQLDRCLKSGAKLIGINNRDLRTFETSLNHTIDLMKLIPDTVAVVGESGIRTAQDLSWLGNAGVKAVLVGESLIRQPDIGLALRTLRGR